MLYICRKPYLTINVVALAVRPSLGVPEGSGVGAVGRPAPKPRGAEHRGQDRGSELTTRVVMSHARWRCWGQGLSLRVVWVRGSRPSASVLVTTEYTIL